MDRSRLLQLSFLVVVAGACGGPPDPPPDPFDGDVPFVIDTTVTGNSNRGHEFGTDLGDTDRWALVEYLKTL
jgi:hypothetical protein